jgi:hypothetical protein
MATTMREWIDLYADALAVPRPSDADIDAMLALAGVAAHASERTAAPVSCWLAAQAGLDPDQGRAVAERVAGTIGQALKADGQE